MQRLSASIASRGVRILRCNLAIAYSRHSSGSLWEDKALLEECKEHDCI